MFSLQITTIYQSFLPELFSYVKNRLSRKRGFVLSTELGQSCGAFSERRNLPKPPFCYLSETFQWLPFFLIKNKPGSVLQCDLTFYCSDVLWRSPSEAHVLAVLGGCSLRNRVFSLKCSQGGEEMSQETPGRAFHELTTTRVQCGHRHTDLPLRKACSRQEQRRCWTSGSSG